MSPCPAPSMSHRPARILARLCLLAALAGTLGAPALAAPEAGTAGGIVETPGEAFATAMRQSIGAPARAELADQAFVRLSDPLVLVPREPAERFLTVTQRPVPDHLIALLLGADGMDAPGYIRFVPAGFTDADDALEWKADDMLDSLRDTVERANAGRAARQLPEQEVRRWIRPPHYDPETHQLTWAALVVPRSAPRGSDGEITFRALAFGREGYIELSMVTSVEQADAVGRIADSFLAGTSFVPGKAYRDAVPGDRKAPGGLAAAMGMDTLHKAKAQGSLFASDRVVPIAGAIVASIGALSLFFYIQRHMRREARRG